MFILKMFIKTKSIEHFEIWSNVIVSFQYFLTKYIRFLRCNIFKSKLKIKHNATLIQNEIKKKCLKRLLGNRLKNS